MTRLVHVDDQRLPGIRRQPHGKTFAYFSADDERITDADALQRIAKLAIPPAYVDVWICPLVNGHIQATGRDARGRKQYRYHADWRAARDGDKFERVLAFGAALPKIRRRVADDLAASARNTGAPQRTSVLAAVVRLLDATLVRVGNDRYARENQSFGLTTLRRRHADVHGDHLHLHFRGKSGVLHDVNIDDPQVARIVRRCQALPGQELFHYRDAQADALHAIHSEDVNDYLREVSGADISAKDFRTWHGSVLALSLLLEDDPRPTATAVLTGVAASLRNTVAVCRKSYVHPQILKACMEGVLEPPLAPKRRRGLAASEAALLAFLSTAAGSQKRKTAKRDVDAAAVAAVQQLAATKKRVKAPTAVSTATA